MLLRGHSVSIKTTAWECAELKCAVQAQEYTLVIFLMMALRRQDGDSASMELYSDFFLRRVVMLGISRSQYSG
jgi:hypothetical protein